MTLMLFGILGIDQNVINENHDKLLQFYHEYGVHQIHDVSGGIDQSKRRNQIFIKTISGRESHLRDIFFTDLDLIITRLKINLGEHLSSGNRYTASRGSRPHQCIKGDREGLGAAAH
jgi:hypothetical protein